VLVPAVSRLQEDGSVTIASDVDETFPGDADGSQAYAITDSGRERLQELLQRPVAALDDPTERHKLMIKLGFIHHLPPADRAGELDTLIDRFYGFRQEWTEALEAHDEATMAPFDAHGYRVKLVELSIEILDTIIRWLEEIRSDARPASAQP
jgi:DNA-binding PadR family transcriptional regulator